MKYFFTMFIVLLALHLFGQGMTLQQWQEEAKTNIRLQPKYGLQPKTDAQKEADNKFIESTMKIPEFNGSRTAASNEMISLGFNYLGRGDVKTAMYRFNQAYLLDSTNTDIYWGYGAVYMNLGDYESGRKMYEEGLAQNASNTHLLTDMGTSYLSQYYILKRSESPDALPNIDTALIYLNKSYQLDQKNAHTTFKLSICYFIKGDCDNAWKYYDASIDLGGAPIPPTYQDDLREKCKKKKK